MNHPIWHVQIFVIFRRISSNLEALLLVSIVSENRSAPRPRGPANLLLSMSGRLRVCWESSHMLPHKTQHTSSQKMKRDAHPRNLTTCRMLCVAYKKCCRTEISHQKIRVNQLSNCGSTVTKENVSFKLPDYKGLLIGFIHILGCILTTILNVNTQGVREFHRTKIFDAQPFAKHGPASASHLASAAWWRTELKPSLR